MRLRQDLGEGQSQIAAPAQGAMPQFLQLFLRHREQHFVHKVPFGHLTSVLSLNEN